MINDLWSESNLNSSLLLLHLCFLSISFRIGQMHWWSFSCTPSDVDGIFHMFIFIKINNCIDMVTQTPNASSHLSIYFRVVSSLSHNQHGFNLFYVTINNWLYIESHRDYIPLHTIYIWHAIQRSFVYVKFNFNSNGLKWYHLAVLLFYDIADKIWLYLFTYEVQRLLRLPCYFICKKPLI